MLWLGIPGTILNLRPGFTVERSSPTSLLIKRARYRNSNLKMGGLMAARLHQDSKLTKEQGRLNPRPNWYLLSGQQQQVHRTTANLTSKKVSTFHLHHIWSGILPILLVRAPTSYMLVALLDGQAKDTLLPTIQS